MVVDSRKPDPSHQRLRLHPAMPMTARSLRWILTLPFGAVLLGGGAASCGSCDDVGDIGCDNAVTFTVSAGAMPAEATSWSVCFREMCAEDTFDPRGRSEGKALRLVVADVSIREGPATLRMFEASGSLLIDVERPVTLERREVDCDLVCYSAVVELGPSDFS